MPAIRPEERLFNLVLALMATRNGLTKDQIFSSVRGFADGKESPGTAALDRLFERDKKFLRSFGVVVEVEDDPAFSDNQSQRYRISPESYEFPPGVEFTTDELRLIGLAGAVWRQGTLSTAAQQAMTKLRGLGVDVSGSGPSGPVRVVVNEPNVAAITAAIAEEVPLEFGYLAPHHTSVIGRRVLPIYVFVHHNRWHMFAWNGQSRVFRTYLVSRIVGLAKPAPVSPDDVPHPTAPQFSAVVAELEDLWKANVAKIAVQPRSEAQVRLSRRAENPGEPTLRIHYTDASLLADELCSYGAEVAVESPPELKELVIAGLTLMRDWGKGERA